MKILNVVSILLVIGTSLWSNEESSEVVLDPIDSHFNASSIGYTMGGARHGVFYGHTVTFIGTKSFSLGLGTHSAIFAIPQLGIDLKKGLTVKDSWKINIEIGPVGMYAPQNRNTKNRIILWQQISPTFIFEGFMANRVDANDNISLIYIFEYGVIMRNAGSLYLTEHIAFTVGFALGVIDELAELENGKSVDLYKHSAKQYPYLYLDVTLGISMRY